MLVNLKELKNTPDDLLLERFPGYSRKVLRDLKRGLYEKPKILVLDIETAPIKAFLWGVWEQNVGMDQIIQDWFMFCWSAKWLDKRKVMSSCLTPKEALAGDDKRIVRELIDLLNQADIIVAHNGDKFDVRKINARILYHGLEYPKDYESFDTLKICRREFGLTMNKLDYVCRFLKIKGKLQTGGQKLWNDCREGNQEALTKMSRYCDNDVKILDEVFKRLLPYIRSNPKRWGIKKKYAL